MSQPERWVMPDGTITADFKKHKKAWRDLYVPVEREFGMRCLQYYPGATFILKEDGEERTEPMPTITFPTWFLIMLARLCNQRRGGGQQ